MLSNVLTWNGWKDLSQSRWSGWPNFDGPPSPPINSMSDGKPRFFGKSTVFHTSSILRVVPPVRQVNLSCARDDQLQLPGVKYRHQPGVHHLEYTHKSCPLKTSWPEFNTKIPKKYLVEASDQALGLLNHSPLYPPLYHPLNVFLLVLLRDSNIGSPRLQLPFCDLMNKNIQI